MTNKDTARLRHALRRRDVAIQGGINPMPAEKGAASVARLYSGRLRRADWVCPFQVGQDVCNV